MKVFICHATEDKQRIATNLATALCRKGLEVWYDDFSLKIGDSLIDSINKGIAECDYGIVIISPNFLNKRWSNDEMKALQIKQRISGKNIILPIWFEIGAETIAKNYPLLSDTVALSTDKMSLDSIVDKLWGEIYSADVDLHKIAPTSIAKLDQMLGGGLRRRSSIVIEGPKGVGKTTLAIQIQKAALERGDYCNYMAYSEMSVEIIHHFLRMGCPIDKYIKQGKFKILDSYSAINEITADEVAESLGDSFSKAVIRVNDPFDINEYYRMHNELLDNSSGAINVIDSTNTRFDMFGGHYAGKPTTERYFNKFKSKGKLSEHIGIHIAKDVESHQGLLALLGNLEDGVIRLRFQWDGDGRRTRHIQVENIEKADTKWHEFFIKNEGISIL